MRVEQWQWTPGSGWSPGLPGGASSETDLVLVFAATDLLKNGGRLDELRQRHPEALFCGCSTAGEIAGTRVRDDSLVATAVRFESTRVAGSQVRVAEYADSRQAGERLVAPLLGEQLVHLLVLSDGLHVNGSELVAGILGAVPDRITVSGGLAADGVEMGHTLVTLGNNTEEGLIAAVGFYGDRLRVGCGSLGGWDPFGPERLITRSRGNVLYELDGQDALGLYKKYLGERAAELPASALLFPLSLRLPDGSSGLVRTVVAIDPGEPSMTFAGDVPEGAYARLMRANFERLIDGATGAARTSCGPHGGRPAELAILVSCVGRKLVLQQRVEEEVEGVREVVGADTILTGFYSLGEISPFTPEARCELHNQTMTITTLGEA
jgi:hypothetical protein